MKPLKDQLIELDQLITELIHEAPPLYLIGTLWGWQATANLQRAVTERNTSCAHIYYLLEKIHAVIGGKEIISDFQPEKDSKVVETLMAYAEAYIKLAQAYCVECAPPASENGELVLQAHLRWALSRGYRYPTLEIDFLQSALKPHAEAIYECYGMSLEDILNELRKVIKKSLTGIYEASDLFKKAHAAFNKKVLSGKSREAALAELKSENLDPDEFTLDLFFGGICNISKNSRLPERLLKDMAYLEPAISPSDPFALTTFGKIPAKTHPLLKINGDYYYLDPFNYRDNFYRCVEWSLKKHISGYKEIWNKKQAMYCEDAFKSIFANQLESATVLKEIYYKPVGSLEWAEADVLILTKNVLIQIEAKAGVMPMHPPYTQFETYQRTCESLITKAYAQSKRFLEYLNATDNQPIYKLEDGVYKEISKISLSNYDLVLPIGLTLETFSPFSANSLSLLGTTPILDKHPFISLSVDDLVVLNKLFESEPELIHYFAYRQKLGGISKLKLIDELDYAGMYLDRNLSLEKELLKLKEKGPLVVRPASSQTVDRHFGNPYTAEKRSPPSRSFNKAMVETITAIKGVPLNYTDHLNLFDLMPPCQRQLIKILEKPLKKREELCLEGITKNMVIIIKEKGTPLGSLDRATESFMKKYNAQLLMLDFDKVTKKYHYA